jgi:hypothetical protein
MKLVIVVVRGYCISSCEIVQKLVISSHSCDMLHTMKYCSG